MVEALMLLGQQFRPTPPGADVTDSMIAAPNMNVFQVNETPTPSHSRIQFTQVTVYHWCDQLESDYRRRLLSGWRWASKDETPAQLPCCRTRYDDLDWEPSRTAARWTAGRCLRSPSLSPVNTQQHVGVSGLVVSVELVTFSSNLTAGHLQATLSKLVTYRVLRSTQPPTLRGTGNE